MSKSSRGDHQSEMVKDQRISYHPYVEDYIDGNTPGHHVDVMTSSLKMDDVYKMRDKRLNQMLRMRSFPSYSETSFDGSMDTGKLCSTLGSFVLLKYTWYVMYLLFCVGISCCCLL